MQRINHDIKSGQFHKVYLLYGEEDYLRKQYRDRLKSAITGGGDTINYTYMEGASADVSQLIDLAETLPFFADRRLIICENTGWFKGKKEDAKAEAKVEDKKEPKDDLADYLNEVCDTTVIVFVEKEADKRLKRFKAVSNAGLTVEFGEQDESTLKRWIAGMIKNEGKRITENDLMFFLEMCGTDMVNIKTELEKLFCYCMDKEIITAQDIQEVCSRTISDQVFEMINAMAEKKQRKALDLYYDLLALKVEPFRILALISRQYNLLLQIKQLKAKGHDNKGISGKVGLPPYVVGKYVAQSSRFKMEYLRQALKDCLEMDEAVKTNRMNSVISVEVLLVKFSSQ